MSTKQYQHYLIGASAVLLVVISFFTFTNNAGYLFPGGDGMGVLVRIAGMPFQSATAFGVSANMLEGLGDMAPVNYRFVPSYNLGLLILGAERAYAPEFHVLVNTALALELFLATYVAARCFGFGLVVSSMAAWMTPLLLLPYFGFPLLYPLLTFSPHASTTISENLLILAAFTRLGRPLKDGTSPLWKDAVLCAAITLMLAHMTIWSPLAVTLWLPSLVVLGVGLFLTSATRGEVLSKIIWAAVAFLIWVGFFGVYSYGQFVYTATRFWGPELENFTAEWQFVSSWFRPLEQAGKIVIAVALFGLLLALFTRPLRTLATAVLAFMAILFGGGILMIHTDVWRGPAPVYAEVFIIPVYAMFVAYAVVRSGALVRDAVLRLRPSATRTLHRLQLIGSGIALGIMPAAAIAVGTIPAFAIGGPHHEPGKLRIYGPAPPTRPQLVSMLADRIALAPGSAFRGRVATLSLQTRKDAARWVDIIRANVGRIDHTGNDYHWSGLWPFNIPTLFEYSQVMSPAFFRTAVDLWARPGDQQIRNVVVLREADAKTLALFGVKFVISDAALPSPLRLEATERISDSEMLYLYEVPDVNLGGYSPTEVTKVTTFKQALEAISSPAFDARRTAIVFDGDGDLKRSLVPAANVQIRIDAEALIVTASSSGSSMLVLPFEFSRCLRVSSNSRDVPVPAIMRADGPLTGLLFSNQLNARIEYFTGPLSRPGCRIQDASEFSRLIGR